jgi:cytochrome c556
MLAKTLWKCAAAGAVLAVIGSVAAAQMGPIESRQACMKANGKAMGVMVPVIKGEAPFDKAAIDAALTATEAACAGWADWWGEDTMPGGAVKTRAKPEIWSDKAGFEAAGAAYGKALGAVKAAADEAAFKAAFPALGGSCQGCHEKYQAPQS